ncbi:MAG: ABC transporter ATP-binding protein [Thermoplasmata archaeon]
MKILEAQELRKYYRRRGSLLNKKYTKAVDGVSIEIEDGEIFGIVGETGSGKTTVARLIMGLVQPTSGTVKFEGQDLSSLKRKELRRIRTRIQMIFQDPYGALDPRFKIRQIVEEPLKLNHIEYDNEQLTRVMEAAGLKPVEDFSGKYPHQLSGGQRQRVLIARAMVLDPRFLIADEPASMLDVSLKAGILNHLKRINTEQKTTMLVISHDISLASYLSQEIAVLYSGKIVEKASKREIINNPLHPYTKVLIDAVPELGKEIDDVAVPARGADEYIEGQYACSFYPRCKFATDLCRLKEPPLKEVEKNHYVACHLY